MSTKIFKSSGSLAPCKVCETPREPSTLINGVCPFCDTGENRILETSPKPRKTAKTTTPAPAPEPSTPAGPPESSYAPPLFNAEAAEANPLAELAARELARRRFLHFVKRFRPKYLAGWVHEDICRRLERFLGAVERGEEPRMLLMMPPRSGKQLADDTLVPTPLGWRTHGELRSGDEVFHPSGATVRVLRVSEKTPSDVRVTFSDGSEVYCHENHEWTLYNRMRREWQTIETNHFLTPTRFGKKKQVLSAKRVMYQLPVVGSLRYSSTEFTLHPYVLGAWLGDGSAGKPCITGAASDSAITDKIQSLGYPVSTVCTHNTTGVLTTYFSGPRPNVSGRMTLELQQLGIYKQKRIPEHYQRLSTELRLELLAGLVDTDGTADKSSRITITTVSLPLAQDILQLCTGLGFRPYMQEVQPTLSTSGIQGKKVCYVVGFQPTMPIPVTLERKKVTRIAKQRRIGLVSVERVESGKQGNCIEVDSPDGLYVVGEKLITTHNSELGSRHFPAWVLGKHPDWEIIAASHTASLTLSFSRYIRDIMRDPAFKVLFPECHLDPASQSTENWNLLNGGGYLAAGVGTGITGRGAHILLLDDLVKDENEATSATITDGTWSWYSSTAYTRLAPGGGVLGIMTWWSEADWAGRIQEVMASGEGDKFEIVRYPAINEEGDEYLLADDTIVEILPGSPVPEGARMTRPKGTAIHPERYSTKAMQRIKNNLFAAGEQWVWNALYQQNPVPDDGTFFTKDMFRYYGMAPSRDDLFVYQAWDFAITEGQGKDYTVGVTIGQDHRGNLYVLDVVRFQSGDSYIIIDEILNFAQKWLPELLGFEDGQIWKALSAVFEKACEERRYYPSTELLKPLTDKKVRASPLRGLMQRGKVYFDKQAEWFQPLVKEFTRFMSGGKHDDIVDATSWCARLTLTRHAPKQKVNQPKTPSWRDKLHLHTEGEGGSHMSA